MKRQWLCAILLVLSIALLSVGRQQVAPDVVSSFKEITARHIASYETDHRVSVGDFGGGRSRDGKTVLPSRYRREWFSAEPKYSVDVQSTNSLISPYLGIFEFKLHRYLSKMWDTREEAEKDTTAVVNQLVKHKHTFGYQDKKWVPTDRKHFTEEPLSSIDELNKWWDCDEVSSYGKTNLFGCHEDLQAAPTPTPKPQAPRQRKRPQ